ncbi:MAG TPA: acyl-CoA dehydrogenase, partial [Brevundimonas sp.]|nr:acyl-CoA dehydrogenase [Brevundimonas sp.]
MSYRAPLRDLGFTLKHVLGLEDLQATGAYPDLDADVVDAVLEAAGQVSEGTLAPLNVSGDRAGSKLEGDGVIPAPGFGEAYRTFIEGGWMGLAAPTAHGGQGLPKALELAAFETVHSANMAFGLCPMLSLAAIEALEAHGTE